jgi:hypothetical protein
MLRSLLRVSAAVALAVLVSPLSPSAAPAPGLAYDEIVHIVIGATPPPPGNFQADVAALNAPIASATPTPAARKRGIGFGALAGAVLGGGGAGSIAGSLAGDAVSISMDNAMQQSLGTQFAALGSSIRSFLQPHLIRYAYYNGWERVDDVADQTATIRKCDMGQVYKLDLAKKTYSIYDPNSEPAPSTAPPAPQRGARPQPAGASAPAPPGTAIADISATTKALGPMRIENQSTAGYDSTASFATTQATGSCRNASASITTEEYLSALNRPLVTSCPIRRAPVPESADEVLTPPQPTGGCRPTLTFHHSGPPVPVGKLSLYTLVTMNAAASATPAPTASGASNIGFLTERGNIKTLGATDVSLFSVPPDFTKTP